MADNPQAYARAAARPVPYTTAIGRAMNMQAIVNGWLPEVRGWHCTVSDQFMLHDALDAANAPLGGGKATPTVMEFPITYDGVWVEQHPVPTRTVPIGSYFNWPVLKVFQRGPTQPDPQPVPAGYRAYVTKVSVEVGWVNGSALPQTIWDPGDYTRWFWKKKPPITPSNPTPVYAVVPGAAGRPCQSRTLYGAPSYMLGIDYYTATGVNGPQQIKVAYTGGGGTGTPFVAGQIAVFAGGATGIVEQSIKTGGVSPNETGFIWLKAGSVTNVLGLTGAISQLPTAGPTATAGVYEFAEPPGAGAASYQQLYHYPSADMPPIFLEAGDLSVLRVENYTLNTGQGVAVSMSVSGVMWPIGLEGS